MYEIYVYVKWKQKFLEAKSGGTHMESQEETEVEGISRNQLGLDSKTLSPKKKFHDTAYYSCMRSESNEISRARVVAPAHKHRT